MTPQTILIAAGGTGGHIFPGIALADALKRVEPDARVSFIGTERGLEKSLIPDAGYPLHLISMRPLARKVGLEAARALASVAGAVGQARRIIRDQGADVVAGMGGYPSLPTIAAARWAGVPSVIHESGAVAGLANKTAARFTNNIALSFPEALADFPTRKRPRVTGMPLSDEIARLDRSALRDEARKSFDLPEDCVALLVMGGSLGALTLNRVAIGLAKRWMGRDDVRIVLKTGRDHLDATVAELAASGASEVVRPVSFLERMDLAYAAADVALTRAGAGTVAELPAAGLPAVVVPYPHAPRDHQTRNAMPLARIGAAFIVPNAEATPERIGPLIESLVEDRGRLDEMSERARTLARPRAAEDLARWVLELAGKDGA